MRTSSLIWVFSALVAMTSAATFTNPLVAQNGSDPQMTYADGYYYLMTTTWTNLQITRSRTLDGIRNGERKVVWTDEDPNRCCNLWAPELHKIDNRWYIYYTAGTSNLANLDGQRMHVLKGGANPFDSYQYASQLAQDWSIDGTVLRVNKRNYLVYSCFSAVGQSLCIAPMNSPTSVGAFQVLSEPTQDWERIGGAVNEGPAPLYHNGRIFMAYSASFCWTDSYQLGLLTFNGGDPMDRNRWSKSAGPVFSSANNNWGPGHNSFINSPDGSEVFNVYHATQITTGNCDGNRYTAAQKVNWRSDGTPDFGSPAALGTRFQGPRGE